MNKTCLGGLLLALMLSACAQPQAQVETPPPGQPAWAEQVSKAANLYRVEDKLYRSEQPVEEDVALLQSLNVKSVVNLRYFNRSGDRKVLADRGIALFNRPLLTWRITPKQVAETLYLIEQQQAEGPVLIHCYHGADRTGLIAGMYRIIYQGWTAEQAKNEMRHGPISKICLPKRMCAKCGRICSSCVRSLNSRKISFQVAYCLAGCF